MSAGRDVRGIKRGHQFDKVEMYIYCKPEESEAMHQKMLKDAEETCAQLGIPYRVKQLCTGDIGFGASVQASAASITDGTLDLNIEGMTCASCAAP